MTKQQKRRLAAIVAADVGGYSALMGADKDRTVLDLKHSPDTPNSPHSRYPGCYAGAKAATIAQHPKTAQPLDPNL